MCYYNQDRAMPLEHAVIDERCMSICLVQFVSYHRRVMNFDRSYLNKKDLRDVLDVRLMLITILENEEQKDWDLS